ncbi:MAG TPA: hypothetical protein PKN56_03735 [Leptospiraceae bacterium]|nr:hypothetical protein [Leptospiraceae bacterium]HNM04960.1 hypothetical protein [Leptospiraceae bacterium]HNN02650.1 hypothetical protein [Leptospiraceae bacterium]
MIYSFETFTSIFLQEIEGKIYGGSIVALGNSDMVIHAEGKKYFIEVKKYCSPRKSEKGKTQPACYVKKAGLRQGVYPVFLRKNMDEDVSDCSSEIIDEIILVFKSLCIFICSRLSKIKSAIREKRNYL